MKVVADEQIPYLRGVLEGIAAEVVYAPGQDIGPALVRDADALLVRTRTRCDRALLAGSRVRFIATATIGYDHIDTDYCRRSGIAWVNAPGCNAASVAQYVESALYVLQQERGLQLEGRTLGVVGVGHVGSKVARLGRELGMRVLLCDPPKAEEEAGARMPLECPTINDKNTDVLPHISRHENSQSNLYTSLKGPQDVLYRPQKCPEDVRYLPLSALAEQSDILTLHVPLTRTGRYPTLHLVDAALLRSLRRKPVLINTSRGEVVDTAALLRAMDEGWVSDAIVDVWEHEPHIDHTLLNRALLATPHIAGYSADGKANATRAALDALCAHFDIRASYTIAPPPPPCPIVHAATRALAALQIYDPRRDCQALRQHPDRFEQIRGHYPLRRERQAYTIQWG